MHERTITVDLPEPPPGGAFHSSPSGDNEYEDAVEKHRKLCNEKILAAVPLGFSLKAAERKTETVVKHYAVLQIVRES